MGKSIVGVEIFDALARQKLGSTYHSLEMPRLQVAARQIASRLERRGIRLSFGSIIKGAVDAKLAEHVAAIARGSPDKSRKPAASQSVRLP